MTIENRTLYNLYQSVKIQYAEAYLYGLYIEGFSGGVTVYAKGKALYRHTVYGDNKTRFCSYIGEWQKKDGETDTGALDQTRKMDGGKAAQKIREFTKIFEAERFNKFTVIGKEFRKVVDGVDAINRGEKTHDICLSARNGVLDVASWPNEIESAAWQVKIDASEDIGGAVMVEKRHLDTVKGKGAVGFACLEINDKAALALYAECVTSGTEAVFPLMKVDPERFMEVLEYEYKPPEKQELKLEAVEKRQSKPEPLRESNPRKWLKEYEAESKPEPQKERVIGDRYVEYSEDFSGFVVRTVSKNGNDSYAAGIAKSCGIPVGGVYRFNTHEEAEKWIVDNPVRQKRKRTAAITEKPPVKAEPVIAEKPKRKPVRRMPVPIKENSAFTGWTYNRLGTKQTLVCRW